MSPPLGQCAARRLALGDGHNGRFPLRRTGGVEWCWKETRRRIGMSELKRCLAVAAAATGLLLPGVAAAAALKVTVDDTANGKALPGQYAFCVPAAQGHVGLGANKNPKLSWSRAPKGTKSFAVIVLDPDVPSVPTDVNKEGKTIPKSLKRTVFYHWVLVDIPATVNS